MEKHVSLIALVTLSLIFILLGSGFVIAQEESSIEISITYFANFTHDNGEGMGDMSDKVFVGTDNEPIGEGNVIIPLTENGEPIIDPSSDGNVPGLHVSRGEDETGAFIDFTSYGIHGGDIRESLKFEVELIDAIFTDIFNGPPTGGDDIYENPENGICGIFEDQPEDYIPLEDEYSVEIDGTEGSFCTVTKNGIDRVRLYYEMGDDNGDNGDEILEITNVVTNPDLPLENDGSEINIEVDFDSNKFPITVAFSLFDENDDLADEQGSIEVADASELPVIYTLPGNLDEGVYELHMIVEDSEGNVVDTLLGVITVVFDDDDGGDDGNDDENDGDSNKNEGGPKVVIGYQVPSQNVSTNAIRQEEIILEPIDIKEKSQSNVLLLWVIVLIALIIILIVLIIMASFKK